MSTCELGMSISAANNICRRSVRMFRSGWHISNILCTVGTSFMADSNSRNQMYYWSTGSHRVCSRSICVHVMYTVSSSSSSFGAGEGWWKSGITMLASRRTASMSSSPPHFLPTVVKESLKKEHDVRIREQINWRSLVREGSSW